MIPRPEPGDCSEYYFTYIDQVGEGDVLEGLAREIERTSALLSAIPEERVGHRYAPDKWTIREVVAHMIDAERVFANRAFAFGRGDAQPIPGMDQDAYVQESDAESRTLADLTAEFVAVRASSLALLRSFPERAWGRSGVASGNAFTVRAFPYILLGHELHHRRILKERYLADSV